MLNVKGVTEDQGHLLHRGTAWVYSTTNDISSGKYRLFRKLCLI